jgi:hypothetical protein
MKLVNNLRNGRNHGLNWHLALSIHQGSLAFLP